MPKQKEPAASADGAIGVPECEAYLDMFVTCLALVLDPGSGALEFANAGHDVPYVRTKDGVAELPHRGLEGELLVGQLEVHALPARSRADKGFGESARGDPTAQGRYLFWIRSSLPENAWWYGSP